MAPTALVFVLDPEFRWRPRKRTCAALRAGPPPKLAEQLLMEARRSTVLASYSASPFYRRTHLQHC